jgi:hypothetical protein
VWGTASLGLPEQDDISFLIQQAPEPNCSYVLTHFQNKQDENYLATPYPNMSFSIAQESSISKQNPQIWPSWVRFLLSRLMKDCMSPLPLPSKSLPWQTQVPLLDQLNVLLSPTYLSYSRQLTEFENVNTECLGSLECYIFCSNYKLGGNCGSSEERGLKSPLWLLWGWDFLEEA